MKPAKDFPFSIAQGQAENVEPDVDPISATMAALNIEGLARLVCLYHRVDCVLQVIRMNDVGGLPTFQLLECLVEIFEGRLIDALDFTGRCGDGDRCRNAVDDQTKTKIAGSQCFLSALESHDEIVFACSPFPSRFHGKRMRPSGSKCPHYLVSVVG